jgi:hypothetical protein
MAEVVRVITSPEECTGAGPRPKLFLAGGITGCPDWQADVCGMLRRVSVPLDIINPRRAAWSMEPGNEEAQIAWEHRHLLRADAILFWFPCETLCPIALLELGAWLCRPKELFIACHPEYARRRDVVIQARLERGPVPVVGDTLEYMAGQAAGWARGFLPAR